MYEFGDKVNVFLSKIMPASVKPDTVAAGVSIIEDGFLFSVIWYGETALRDLRAGRPDLAKAFEVINRGYVFSLGDGIQVL